MFSWPTLLISCGLSEIGCAGAGGVMKDSDKLKLMLLAWNYHNQTQGKWQHKKQYTIYVTNLYDYSEPRHCCVSCSFIWKCFFFSGVFLTGFVFVQVGEMGERSRIWRRWDLVRIWRVCGRITIRLWVWRRGRPHHRLHVNNLWVLVGRVGGWSYWWLFLAQSPLAETGSAHDETSSSGNKEDEDDDDDESDDRIDTQQYDPERLKAFNVSIIISWILTRKWMQPRSWRMLTVCWWLL